MKLSIYSMEHSSIEFKKTHTVNVGGTPKEGREPKYFTDFKNEMIEFKNQMLEFVKRQEKFNELIMKRIDNLVSKNNLKE